MTEQFITEQFIQERLWDENTLPLIQGSLWDDDALPRKEFQKAAAARLARARKPLHGLLKEVLSPQADGVLADGRGEDEDECQPVG